MKENLLSRFDNVTLKSIQKKSTLSPGEKRKFLGVVIED